MKKKVLLLNPPAETGYVKEGRCQHRAAVFSSVYPPMTLASIASTIRQEAEAKLIDAIGSKQPLSHVVDEVVGYDPDIIIVNTTTPTYANDVYVIKQIKKVSKAKVVVFGVHVTTLWENVLEIGEIDAVVVGEPEPTCLDVVKKERLEDVEGVAYRIGGEKKLNLRTSFMDLKDMRIPSWDLVDLDNYRLPVTGDKYVLITTGRGCPFGCSFCVSQPYYGSRYRRRPPEDIIKEIEYVKKMGVDNFFFFSETFTLDKDHVSEICDKIVEKGLKIRWICNSRVDTVDAQTLEKMKAAGCWMISFGIESSDQKVLDSVNKGITVEQVRQSVELASKTGLAVVGHFIFGLPNDSEKSVRDTIEFALSLPLTFSEFYLFTPFPGSRLFDEYGREQGERGWENFEYSKNIISDEIDLESLRSQAYKRFYLRPQTLYRILKLFGLKRLPALIKTGINFITHI